MIQCTKTDENDTTDDVAEQEREFSSYKASMENTPFAKRNTIAVKKDEASLSDFTYVNQEVKSALVVPKADNMIASVVKKQKVNPLHKMQIISANGMKPQKKLQSI